MTKISAARPESEDKNPAIERLAGLAGRLEQALQENSGKNSDWENSARNKIVVLKLAIDTIRMHEELPPGMSLKDLTDSAEKIIGHA